MKTIGANLLDQVLTRLSGYKFTTQEFIPVLRRQFPVVYQNIIDEYGVGGRGSGRHYSANVHVAKSLKHHQGNVPVKFLSYIKAPPSWGSPVIAFWECGEGHIETVRIKTAVEDDIHEIINDPNLDETEKQSLILSRIGQSHFRRNLAQFWKGCSVTGCQNIEILIASHIKPWSECTNEERLDLYNGLLLVPNLDRLFDKGLISFKNDGKIIISSFVSAETLKILNINRRMRVELKEQHLKYITFHRENIFLYKHKDS